MTKRKRKSNNAGDLDLVGGHKRSRQSPPIASQSISYGRVDPTYGQRSAIPGLDDDAYNDTEGELMYDDEGGITGDALAYLRSVRIEASGIPTLLVVPNAVNAPPNDEDGEETVRTIYNNGVGDSRGYYEDGAYTAAPVEPLTSSPPSLHDGRPTRDPQAACYSALLQRFGTLRKRLKGSPPRHAIERLDADHPSHMASSAADYEMWRRRLRNTEPLPAQLVRMDKDTVLKLLRLLARQKFIRHEKEALKLKEQRCVQLWIWSLLAKLPEPGELVSEEIGVVRDLGKRAIWVGVEIKGMDMEALDDGGGSSGQEEGATDGEAGEDVLDVEVNANGDEVGELNEDVDENMISSDGNEAFEQQLNILEPPISSNVADPKTSQVFNSALPTSTANHATPSSPKTPSAHITIDITMSPASAAREALTTTPQDQVEEAQLAAARQRLLAHLSASPPTEAHAEAIEDETASVLGHQSLAGEIAAGKEAATVTQSVEEQMVAFRASLDAILTIAGEVYGQRDLLEFREVWS